jgi:hypothetical protein
MTKPTPKKKGAHISTENRGEERPRGKGAQHDKLAVGDVQDPGNAILQTEAHSNQGVYAPHQQAANGYIQELHQHMSCLVGLIVLVQIV